MNINDDIIYANLLITQTLRRMFQKPRQQLKIAGIAGTLACLGMAISLPSAAQEAGNYTYDIKEISEVESLRKQLQHTEQELHDYKSRFFRSSHPMDLAKISELSQQLAEQKSSNEKLSALVKTLEKDYHTARKQASTLETSADALSTLVRTQRAQNESQEKNHQALMSEQSERFEKTRQDLIDKIYAYQVNHERTLTERTTNLYDHLLIAELAGMSNQNALLMKLHDVFQLAESHRKQIEKLLIDLQAAQNIVLIKEQYIKNLENFNNQADFLINAFEAQAMAAAESEETHLQRLAKLDEELEDALQEAAMLKFSLGDARKIADSKEQYIDRLLEQIFGEENKNAELKQQIANTLNYLTSAVSYAGMLEQAHEDSQDDIGYLKILLDDVSDANAMLQNQNDSLSQQYEAVASQLRGHREFMASELLKKEELLTDAAMYFQALLEDHQYRNNLLQDQLLQHHEEYSLAQAKHESEKSHWSNQLAALNSVSSVLLADLDLATLQQNEAANRHRDLETKFQELSSKLHSMELALQQSEEHMNALQAANATLDKENSEIALQHGQALQDLAMKESHYAALYGTYEADKKAVEAKLQEVILSLEDKEQAIQISTNEAQSLQTSNQALKEELSSAHDQHSTANERIAALEMEMSLKEREYQSNQLSQTQAMNQLQADLNEAKMIVASLTENLQKLSNDYGYAKNREQQLKQNIHTLASLAEHQDHALNHAHQTLENVQMLYEEQQKETAHLRTYADHLQKVIEQMSQQHEDMNSAKEHPLRLPSISSLMHLQED